MKFIFIFSILVFLIKFSTAQFSYQWIENIHNKHLLYANGDLMSGQNLGGGLGLCFVYNEKYSLQVGYSATGNGFHSNATDVMQSMEQNEQNKVMENYHLMLGHYFELNSKQRMRIIVQGGPGLSRMVQNHQYKPVLEDTYSCSKIICSDYMSIILNTKVEILATQILGFSAGPTLIVNRNETYLGFAAGLIFGVLTTEKLIN